MSGNAREVVRPQVDRPRPLDRGQHFVLSLIVPSVTDFYLDTRGRPRADELARVIDYRKAANPVQDHELRRLKSEESSFTDTTCRVITSTTFLAELRLAPLLRAI
jgi:hypothetical protein